MTTPTPPGWTTTPWTMHQLDMESLARRSLVWFAAVGVAFGLLSLPQVLAHDPFTSWWNLLPLFGALVLGTLEHGCELVDRVVHVDVADVQRREAEPGDVRGAEVAHHPACDERLHDAVRRGVPQRHVAAAPAVVPRRDHLEAGQPRVDQVDEQVGERERLRTQVAWGDVVEDGQRRVQGGQGQHRGSADGEPPDAGRGAVVTRHRERLGVSPPAGDRLVEDVLVDRSDVAERR